MSKYIDKDELIRQLTRMSKRFADKYINWSLGSAVEDIIGIVDMQKEQEVSPIVHAHWIKDKGYMLSRCSECKNTIPLGLEYKHKYCFNCGAKMDEETKDV